MYKNFRKYEVAIERVFEHAISAFISTALPYSHGEEVQNPFEFPLNLAFRLKIK